MELRSHGYPDLLARQLWPTWVGKGSYRFGIDSRDALGRVLSVAYQASLLHEEGRQVTCRIALCAETDLDPAVLTPYSFRVLNLSRARPFDEQEIRRLSPAVTFYRSILAVTWSEGRGFQISAVVNTGEWSRDLHTDLPGMIHPIPEWLIIHVRAPGNLVVHLGSERLATLMNGRIEEHVFNVFSTNWMQRHLKTPANGKSGAAIQQHDRVKFRPDLREILDVSFFRRIIRIIRDRRLGGTLVIGPRPLSEQLLEPGGALTAKYRVEVDGSSTGYLSLVDNLFSRLTAIAEKKDEETVGWLEFLKWNDELPYSFSSSYLDIAGWLADMAAVDGCLLLDPQFMVLAYGVEIRVPGTENEIVYRAMDLEASVTIPESAEHAGTRHRTAYRLCRDYPEYLAVVVSQDGAVRFIANHRDQVTYWSQLAL
ncbi:MAG TPA: hypothetical protein VHY59_08420 [Chthoniobacterales bacterium]|nr:hypothetical protein [Chthoniobacterales bacterium]